MREDRISDTKEKMMENKEPKKERNNKWITRGEFDR